MDVCCPQRLRRALGQVDTVYPVKALIGVLADDEVSDEEIDAYVASYVTPAAEGGEGEAAAGPQYQFVDTGAGKIRYAKRGDSGDAVLLVHGFGGDLDNWLFNIEAIAEKAAVYALDLPGHGQSTKTIAEPSLAGLSRALVGLMDALGIASAHIVGHSVGGAVAMETALDAVRSGKIPHPDMLGRPRTRDQQRVYRRLCERDHATRAQADPGPALRRPEARQQLVDDVLKYKRFDGVIEALSTLQSHLFEDGRQRANIAPAFQRIACPVLVIWGEQVAAS
jgi:pyruvate dehydrogenase E2 component (dihydrolipoamide acetyltransferase)